MRKLYIVLALIPVLFAGYWFAGARGIETALGGWLADRAAEGWVAEHDGISTSGFPRRFETVVRDLMLADPETGVAWSAPTFTIVAESHRPTSVRAIWPAEQTLSSPYERIAISSGRMEANIGFVPGPRLELSETGIDMSTVALASTAGWSASLARGQLTARAAGDTDHRYDIDFRAEDVVLPREMRMVVDPARILPDIVEGLTVEARIGFDAPWDRFAIEDARPQIVTVDLDDLRARWGDLELRAAGALTVDQDGVPEGRITIKATNWREMLGMARNAGLLPEPLIPTIERALGVLASLSGPPETLDAPLSFQNGFVSFGPIPLGPAPNLRIR